MDENRNREQEVFEDSLHEGFAEEKTPEEIKKEKREEKDFSSSLLFLCPLFL